MKVPEPRKLSSGKWFIQLRLDGESIAVTADTATECKNAAGLIKAEHKAGKRVKASNLTLRQAIDKYIAARTNTLSPATIRGYKVIQKNRFTDVMDTRLKDIKNWQEICNTEAGECSAKTLKNSWMFVASVIREATGRPAPDVRLPQVVIKERPYLEPDDIPKFIEAVKGKPCELVGLLGLSSLRRSEICALKWENVDLKNGRILVAGALVPDDKNKYVPKEANKNQSSRRYVPIMIPRLSEALEAVEGKEGFVVSGHPNSSFKQINAACSANDLPLIGVHGLRHSFASLAYHLGMSEKMAMEIGGWADPGTMHKIYTHLAKKDLAKGQNKMTEFFSNANQNANKISDSQQIQVV